MKNYELAFSIKGFAVFFAVMLPNILWIAYPPANDILTTNISDYPILNNTMFISQWIMLALLMILERKTDTKSNMDTFYIVCCTISLLGYYIFWVLYYMAIISPIVFMGLAILPSVFFIMFSLLQKNNIALFPAIIYAVLHIGITYSNLP